MKNFCNSLRKNEIGEPPWDYDFLINLDEKEYPKYIAKIFNYRTGEKLPLKYDFKKQAWVIDKKKCKTFNQKIQWIKLYGVTDLMRMCTDKVAVRDYVKEKIGEEYLKPVLQIISATTEEPRHSEPNDNLEGEAKNLQRALPWSACDEQDEQGKRPVYRKFFKRESRPTKEEVNIQRPCDTSASNGCPPQYDGKTNDVSTYFDQIQWDKLPNSFVIKCNHGCKWQYIIKNKENFLNTPQLFETVKRQMTGWLEQEYFPWNGFEMQYKGITPKILVELFFQNEDNTPLREIEVYCFNGKPKIFVNVRYDNQREISYYDENFNQVDLILHPDGNNLVIQEKADDYINQTFDLSAKLCTSITRLAKDEMTTGDSRRNDSLNRKQFQEKQLSKDFNFVRCDYFVFNNKLYFEELTFTPYSGLIEFDKKWNKKLGSWIEFKGGRHGF